MKEKFLNKDIRNGLIGVLVFLALIFTSFTFRHKKDVVVPTDVSINNSPQENQDNLAPTSYNIYGDAKCIENQNYFIISQEILNENGAGGFSVENVIVVKFKKDQNQHFECTFTLDKDDFEIRDEYPQFVIALENNFLIVDNGTGPDMRPYLVYNLNAREIVFDDSYVGKVNAQDKRLEYWTPEDNLALIKNCPQPTGGLGAGVDSRVQLDLSTLTKKSLNEYRCSVRQ
jgi:hypothetical protein